MTEPRLTTDDLTMLRRLAIDEVNRLAGTRTGDDAIRDARISALLLTRDRIDAELHARAAEVTDIVARRLEEARHNPELAGMTILDLDVIPVDGRPYSVPAGAMATGVDDAIDATVGRDFDPDRDKAVLLALGRKVGNGNEPLWRVEVAVRLGGPAAVNLGADSVRAVRDAVQAAVFEVIKDIPVDAIEVEHSPMVGPDDPRLEDLELADPGEEWRDIHADACRGITRHVLEERGK